MTVDQTHDDPAVTAPVPKPGPVWGLAVFTILASLSVSAVFTRLSPAMLILADAILLVPVLLYLRGTPFTLKVVFRLQPVHPGVLVASALAGGAVGVLTHAIDTAVNTVSPMPESWKRNMGEWLLADSAGDLAFQIAGLVVAAAVCEELFFRGFLQGALEWWHHPALAIGASSLLFSAAHLNPWWLPSILFGGTVFGMLAYTTGSVYPGMIVHAVSNGFSLLMTHTTTDTAVLRMHDLVMIPSVVALSAVILSIILIRLARRKHL